MPTIIGVGAPPVKCFLRSARCRICRPLAHDALAIANEICLYYQLAKNNTLITTLT